MLYPRDLILYNFSLRYIYIYLNFQFSSFQGRLKAPTQQHIDNIDEVYSVLDGYLQKCRYVAGDRLTIADLSVGASATAAQIIHKIDAER